DLADHHLQAGDHPAGLAAGDEVAVPGRGQGRVAEEEEVAAGRVGVAFEEGTALNPLDEAVDEGEEDAEDRVHAERAEDRPRADLVGHHHRRRTAPMATVSSATWTTVATLSQKWPPPAAPIAA